MKKKRKGKKRGGKVGVKRSVSASPCGSQRGAAPRLHFVNCRAGSHWSRWSHQFADLLLLVPPQVLFISISGRFGPGKCIKLHLDRGQHKSAWSLCPRLLHSSSLDIPLAGVYDSNTFTVIILLTLYTTVTTVSSYRVQSTEYNIVTKCL